MSAIVIEDLLHPQLNEAQQTAVTATASLKVKLSRQTLMQEAEQETGLNYWGPLDFIERLDRLTQEWDNDPLITPLGRLTLQRQLLRYAKNRLLIENLLQEHPEILEEKIEAPLIVAGLPRSGTTHLLNLMAADPRFHSLPLWESYEPVPSPGEPVSNDEHDPRFQRCQQAWEQMQVTTPLLAAMHPMNPEHIHEELELMGPDFASYNFEWLAPCPQWRDYYYNQDQTPHYHYMKKVLQILQWQRRQAGSQAQRWVLKCPQHLEQIPALQAVFPDAILICTHRDPVAVIQSAITMIAYGQRMNRQRVEPEVLLRYWSDRVEHLLQACVNDRAIWPAERSIDVLFHRFMADDLETVRNIYTLAGIPWDEVAQQAIETYQQSHQRGHAGSIRYRLEQDFGITPAKLRARFAFYFEQFPVKAEL